MMLTSKPIHLGTLFDDLARRGSTTAMMRRSVCWLLSPASVVAMAVG
jgi:hypothetical protein